MQLRASLFIINIVYCSTLFAQTPAGVWEGSFLLNGKKNQKMNVRIELIEQEDGFVGIINTRGFNKNTVYGCDYLVTGTLTGDRLNLVRKNVRRGVAMSSADCEWFRKLDLRLQKTSNGLQLNGQWIWMDEGSDQFTATKSQDSVSEITNDELTAYVEEMYAVYEAYNVLLPVEERQYRKAMEMNVDSSDLVIEFSTADSSMHDSIAVVFNGEPVSVLHPLRKSPLRIRLKELARGVNDMIVVSQSAAQNKLTVNVTVKHQGKSQHFILNPGFTRNEVLFFYRKQE